MALCRGLLRKRYTKRIRQVEEEFAKHRRDDEDLDRIGEIRDGSPSPFLRISRDGTFLYHNKAAVPLLKIWRYWKALPQSSPWFHYISSGGSHVRQECVFSDIRTCGGLRLC
jgi:PAS domain-containing protein